KEPYKGGQVDREGTPPSIWDMKVAKPTHFEAATKRYKVPHTECVDQCEKCTGKGEVSCEKCEGWGWWWCKSCNGKKWNWCSACSRGSQNAASGKQNHSNAPSDKGKGSGSSKGSKGT
ncbi:Ssuh2, partial [Symbiodinium pilosum]